MDTTSELGIGVEPVPQAETHVLHEAELPTQGHQPATNGADNVVDLPVDPTKEAVEIVLDYPVEFDGKRYERLTLNLIGIRRKQWKSIKRTFRGLDSSFNPFPIDDEDYQAVVAAEAAQVPLLLMDALDGRDWARVSGAVFQFLGKSLDPRLTRPRP